MSGLASKQARRDIRRAFGGEAVEVIDNQGSALEALAEKVKQQDAQIAFLTKELSAIVEDRRLRASVHLS